MQLDVPAGPGLATRASRGLASIVRHIFTARSAATHCEDSLVDVPGSATSCKDPVDETVLEAMLLFQARLSVQTPVKIGRPHARWLSGDLETGARRVSMSGGAVRASAPPVRTPP